MDYKVLRKEFAMRRLQYDGGRSTSESGISTDTEDDNVEIVETNDESEDDKSEVVETQKEDDQDEVEELENETNANDSSNHHEDISQSMSGTLEQSVIQRDLSSRLDTRERQEAPPVLEIGDNFSELSARTDTTASSEEGNATNNVGQEEEARSKEVEDHSRKDSYHEPCSQVVLNNNKVTVKLIGGKLKVVTEYLPVENIEREASPSKSEQSTKEVYENDVGIETKSVALDCTPIESTPEEQRSAKQLIRQNRIAEEAVDKESHCKERLAPLLPLEELNDEQSTLNGNSILCESVNEIPLELQIEPQTRDNVASQPANELQEVQSHLNGSTNSTPTDNKLVELDYVNVDKHLWRHRYHQICNTRTRTPEEILEARNARLKRLEDQTKNLFHKMSLTSQRSDTLSERLVELHDYYGTSNERHSPRRSRGGSQECDERREATEYQRTVLSEVTAVSESPIHEVGSHSRAISDERREATESQRSATNSEPMEVITPSRAISEERREVMESRTNTNQNE
ncbi:hypothetical protein WDU94_005845 [Cyamophila willieti]